MLIRDLEDGDDVILGFQSVCTLAKLYFKRHGEVSLVKLKERVRFLIFKCNRSLTATAFFMIIMQMKISIRSMIVRWREFSIEIGASQTAVAV